MSDILQHFKVAIIGSGFGGIGTAIRLKQRGINDFVVFERAASVGGVWRDNQYPGAACDVPSHLYSLSFAPNPNWTHSYARQPEIWAYLQQCVRDFNLEPHLRLQHSVHALRWDEQEQHWHIATSHGDFSATLVVGAVGGLSEPSLPTLRGLADFGGALFHTARWDHSVDLRGKRIAIIGTGASAIQCIPHLQSVAGTLSVFQRTAAWVMPRLDRAFSYRERAIYRRFPWIQKLRRGWIYAILEVYGVGFRQVGLMQYAKKTALKHLADNVSAPTLRTQLTPNYTIGCKRILISDDYYPAMSQPNVELVTTAIDYVTSDGIVTVDGIHHPIDVLIFATGFHVTDFPFANHIYDQHGQSLGSIWAGSPQAHLGTSISGFPNLFVLQGPNTGLGHTSVIYMIEAQIEHIMNAITYMDQHAINSIEPRAAVQAAFVADVDQQMQQTVWVKGGCKSWYLDHTGRNATLWPGATFKFWRRVQKFIPSDYVLHTQRSIQQATPPNQHNAETVAT